MKIICYSYANIPHWDGFVLSLPFSFWCSLFAGSSLMTAWGISIRLSFLFYVPWKWRLVPTTTGILCWLGTSLEFLYLLCSPTVESGIHKCLCKQLRHRLSFGCLWTQCDLYLAAASCLEEARTESSLLYVVESPPITDDQRCHNKVWWSKIKTRNIICRLPWFCCSREIVGLRRTSAVICFSSSPIVWQTGNSDRCRVLRRNILWQKGNSDRCGVINLRRNMEYQYYYLITNYRNRPINFHLLMQLSPKSLTVTVQWCQTSLSRNKRYGIPQVELTFPERN